MLSNEKNIKKEKKYKYRDERNRPGSFENTQSRYSFSVASKISNLIISL